MNFVLFFFVYTLLSLLYLPISLRGGGIEKNRNQKRERRYLKNRRVAHVIYRVSKEGFINTETATKTQYHR